MLFRYRIVPVAALAAFVACLPAAAQNKWEVGGAAGFGYTFNQTLSGGPGNATTGFQPGVGGSFWIGNDYHTRYEGEFRYSYQRNTATLSSAGTSTTFGGNSHQFTYDFLIYANSNRAKIRPFLLVGGGVKAYQGTGTEQALQPLLQFAALTKTTQWSPMGNFGGGVKWDLSDRLVLRFEVRDTLSRFPDSMILPVPPYSAGPVLNNITPSVGIAYRWE